MIEPVIKVGILADTRVSFSLEGVYRCRGKEYSGLYQCTLVDDKIFIGDEWLAEWLLEPLDSSSVFELHNVAIGIDFHWERRETQRFSGALQLVPEKGKIRVVNRISTEEYLLSVISSEMSANASLELLKAHAVISRSWLLYPILYPETTANTCSACKSDDSHVSKWYERDAHVHFDVCADDHCQRYQGQTKANTQQVQEAIDQTRGRVLMYDNRICDARYYKACGGATEKFSSCWAETDFDYLQPVRDWDADIRFPDLTNEDNAREWILSSPPAFCNTDDGAVLAQVLNNFDQETTDFYRWKISYTQAELTDLLLRKSGIDFGSVVKLEAVERGPSGRIIQLKITGTLQTVTVGKELEIRKWLSESHLYSSAFVVEMVPGDSATPEAFRIYGAGWGHGVGLCQIGAAVMGEKGYSYQQILTHYFSHAEITKIY